VSQPSGSDDDLARTVAHLQARVDALDAWRAHQSDLLDEHLNDHPNPEDLDPPDDLDTAKLDGSEFGEDGHDRRPAAPTIGGYALVELSGARSHPWRLTCGFRPLPRIG
jgi:hypothetical protein